MMKKQLLLLMTLILCALMLTGCACKHEETEIVNATSAKCLEDGNTGDTRCVKCGEIIAKGERIPATGHQSVGPFDEVATTCTQDGFTGYYECAVCGERLDEGRVIPSPGHADLVVKRASEPTCTQDGYTGDQVCSFCLETMIPGQAIPALGHRLVPTTDETRMAREATCIDAGFTGDERCSVCGITVSGEAIPRIPHDYVDTFCTFCGWKEPGLYAASGEMAMTWQELMDFGYVTVENGMLTGTSGNFGMGTLVIGENVTVLQSLGGSSIVELWLPRSVTKISLRHNSWGNYPLTEDCPVTDIIMFCDLTSIESDTFAEATALRRIVLPEALTSIGTSAFRGCSSLREINLPESVTRIGSRAFEGCTSLESITLPSGLITIDNYAFQKSGLRAIDLPDSVETIGYHAFSECLNLESIVLPPNLKEISINLFEGCTSLKSVDMSACVKPVKLWGEVFFRCDSLTEVKLPPNLEIIDGSIFSGSTDTPMPLTTLEFPEGFKQIKFESFGKTQLSRVIWPNSLIDACTLVDCDLQEIFYRGTEARWNMITGVEAFENVKVTFNYAE